MEAAEKDFIKNEYENVLKVLSECTDDYIYIYDLKNDFYRLSPDALVFYDLPAHRFANASEHILNIVHPDDKAMLVEDLGAISEENAAANEEVSASVEEIAGSISAIAESSKETDEHADQLIENVNYFK